MVNPLKYFKTLFHGETEKTDVNGSRKRKRETEDRDPAYNGEHPETDEDVIITAIKRPRTAQSVSDNNINFFSNFIGNPLEKMAEWIKQRSTWRPSYLQNTGNSKPRRLTDERFKPPDPPRSNGEVLEARIIDQTSGGSVPRTKIAAMFPSCDYNRASLQQGTCHQSAEQSSNVSSSRIPTLPGHSDVHLINRATDRSVSGASQQIPTSFTKQTRSTSTSEMSYAAAVKSSGPRMVSKAVQGQCGDGKHSLLALKPYKKFVATECVRMEEKEKYKQLLQQFTTVPISISPPRSPPDSDRVSISSRASSRIHETIFGDTICRDLTQKKTDNLSKDSLPRQKVVPVHLVKSDATFLSKRLQSEFLNSTKLNNRLCNSNSRTPATQKIWTSPEDDDVICVNDKEKDDDVICIGDENAAEISAIPKVNGDISHYEQSRIEGRKSPFQKFKESVYLQEDWISSMVDRFSIESRERRRKIKEEETKAKIYEEKRQAKDENLEKKIRHQMKIYEKEPAVIEDLPIEEVEIEEEEEFPELTDEMQQIVKDSLRPNPPDQVLVEGFKLQITRTDISTLAGLNWLNDEIINFYMNLLMHRGEQDGRPKVHAFNTFFYPKILNGGHSSVRRWTKRVDIFSMDYILIPVHLGMHWCLAVVDFKKKAVLYYDSMGGNNTQCLNAIKKYLSDESLDKRKQEFDFSGWKTEKAKNIPQQMNGSDCGMFACKFAEYITREAKISFTQEHMPYFRKRMVYEIISKKLLQ